MGRRRWRDGGPKWPISVNLHDCLLCYAVGVEADKEKVNKLISELEGKDLQEVLKAGRAKLASVPAGGAVAAAAPAAGGAAAGGAAAAPKKEEKKEPTEEEVSGRAARDDMAKSFCYCRDDMQMMYSSQSHTAITAWAWALLT